MTPPPTFTAFVDRRMIAAGSLAEVAATLAEVREPALVFEDAGGRVVELDLRHGPRKAVADYERRMASEPEPGPRKGRGRPMLGVVAREVTLLPRHWDWLAGQPGGASAALRRLVEDARRAAAGPDRRRQGRDALYRVMTALGGDEPGYEEATRALFAGDPGRVRDLVSAWPPDVAAYVRRLAASLADDAA